MLNTVYRLVEPRKFEEQFNDIDLFDDKVIVRPTHLSICRADERYYQGKRSAEVLKQKLPMALIHEGIGDVLYDSKGEFCNGQTVAMVPNTPMEEDPIIAENYLRSSKFRASGYDGFMQEYVAMRRDRLVILPEGINKNVAAFTELVSVSYHTINRFLRKSHERRNRIGVWGDGNVAFITSLLLKKRLPETELYIFGIDEQKMSDFVFADATFNVSEIPSDMWLDHAFECVGGDASGTAINQIIDYINPEGTISIMGVSENQVPINTRMVLEKGLQIYGSSRSGVQDFRDTIELFENDSDVEEYLERIIGGVIPVRTIDDMNMAFDIDIQRASGKTVMLWDK